MRRTRRRADRARALTALTARSAIAALLVVGCGARTELDVLRGRPAGMDAGVDAGIEADAGRREDADIEADARRRVDVGPDEDCLMEPSRCDDGDPCTHDDCLPDGLCENPPVACDDGDACTADACDPSGACFSVPLDCDDGDACTVEACDPAVGCVRERVDCDDDDPCTANRCDPLRGCVFPPTDCRGCADGQRDGFLDLARYPEIAACAGGFEFPGLGREVSPTCDRGAGDDGPNRTGRGCVATDLCAPGWHVCASAGEVERRSPDGCAGASDAEPRSFFATRQTGPGCGHCSTGTDPNCDNASCRAGCAQTTETTNDIFGCGDLGAAPASSCGPLDRFSSNRCSALIAPWRCDQDPQGLRESDVVVKPGPGAGGVLCCLD